MNLYILPPLISSALFIFFGWLVYKKNKDSEMNQNFFLICVATFWWQFSWFVLFSINSTYSADILVRVGYIGITFIPFTFYRFSISFFNKVGTFDKILSEIFFVPPLLLAASLFLSNDFVSGYYNYPWGFYPKAGFLHIFYLAILSALALRIIYLAFKNIKLFKDNIYVVKQLKLFLIAMVFYILSAIDFVTNYGINIYPFGFIFIIIFLVIIAYAIVTQQMMNLRFTLRKSMVYFLALVSVFIPVLIWDKFFSIVWPEALAWFNFVAFAAILPLFGRLKKYYAHFSNRYFFSSLYDSRLLVAEVGKSLRATLEPDKMFAGVSATMRPAFHFKSVGVLYYEPKGEYWSVLYNDGFVFSGKKFYLDQEMLQNLFKKRRHPFLVKDKKDPYFESLMGFFQAISAEVVIPIFTDHKISGLMFLGAKESGDVYSNIDIEVLGIIADELSISLENGLLYQRLQDFNAQLQKKIDKATVNLRLKNDELQKVNELKNEFISVISHQLKTPLASSKLTLEIMDIKYGKAFDPEAGVMLHSLSMINEQLINMVNELLDVARIQEGRLKVDIKSIDILSLIKKTSLEFKPLADKRKVVIVEDYCEAQMIDFDLHVAEKAVSNMMSNGIKYNREAKNLFISLKKEADGLLYIIRDEGIGIPAKEQGKIFQKFYQASNAASSNFESSTGLGLYIVKSLVEQLGGKVWFESVEGEGTSFFVKFPYKAVIAPDKKVEPV